MSEITMKKIADLAGVSRSTVSRALSNPEKVNPKTRDAILRIVKEYGYMYHAGAAELIKRKTFLIGLIIPSLGSSIYANTIFAVQSAAAEIGMSVILACSEFNAKKEADILNQFMARRVAGIIMSGVMKENEPLIKVLQKHGIPSIIIWNSPTHPDLCQVGVDNVASASMAVQYLIELGHKRIAMISGALAAGSRVADRIAGYRMIMEKYGLEIPPGYLLSDVPTIANGEIHAMTLLGMPKPPTAIFAASDMLAIGVLKAARKMSVNIPKELSVVGFDDIEFATHTQPPLTTVAIPEMEMSRLAIALLHKLINQEIAPPKRYCLDTQFVMRKSCAPPLE